MAEPTPQKTLDAKAKGKKFRKYEEEETPQDPRMALLKVIGWGAVIAFLGYVVYMMFIGSDPRRELTTVEDTVAAYTQLARGFTGTDPNLPNPAVVGDFLRYFDPDSRRYFEDNYTFMAQVRLELRPQDFNELTDAGRRGHAMLFLVNTPPLGGIARIVAQRDSGPGRKELDVLAGQEHRVYMVQRDGLWYFQELAGVIPRVEERIAPLRERAQAARP